MGRGRGWLGGVCTTPPRLPALAGVPRVEVTPGAPILQLNQLRLHVRQARCLGLSHDQSACPAELAHPWGDGSAHGKSPCVLRSGAREENSARNEESTVREGSGVWRERKLP